MAINLTIDIGNSSAKAALWRGPELVGIVLWGDLSAVDIEHLCAIAGQKPRCAAVCSVADDRRGLLQAAESLADHCLYVNASIPLPIDLSAYATAGTLGADRIAAMTGAMAQRPGTELLVVDCGTAVTYDRVSADGKFLGGNIAPGLGMRLRALHAFTARLPQVDSAAPTPTWGLSTAQAMQAGAFMGITAEVEYYHRLMPAGSQVFITGGRGRDLTLDFDAIYDPDLVLRGLNYIIEYNENL